MSGSHSKKWAIAHASADFDEIAFWDTVTSIRIPSEWPGLQLVAESGLLTDLLPNDVIGRVCSHKLMEVISSFNVEVQWLPVQVQLDKRETAYYFMHFANIPDVLDNELTKFAGGRILAPHLSTKKVGDRSIFCLRQLDNSTIVREDIKQAIEARFCVGVEFESIPAS